MYLTTMMNYCFQHDCFKNYRSSAWDCPRCAVESGRAEYTDEFQQRAIRYVGTK